VKASNTPLTKALVLASSKYSGATMGKNVVNEDADPDAGALQAP